MMLRPPRSTLFPTRRSSDLVNDRHGHLQGDLVLREVARVLRETARDIDEPARYGGEEMARSEEHTSELQSRQYLVCRLLLEKKTNKPQRLANDTSAV